MNIKAIFEKGVVMENKFLANIRNCKDTYELDSEIYMYLDGKNDTQKRELLKPYFSFLVEQLEVSDLIVLLEYANLDKSFYDELNDKISKNKREFFKGIFSKREICGRKIYNNKENELNTISDIAVLLTDELLEEESHRQNKTLSYADIRYDYGGYSSVFIIGDKVLSIGDREEYKLPNHRRILQPLIRPDISSLISEDVRIPSTIEVSERVDMESDITNEEFYTLYKELRDDNILWTDIKKENVGRLLRPNKRYFSKNLADDKKARGLTRDFDSDSDCLGVGEVVIVDKDHIYDLNTRNIEDIDFSWNELAIFFDERYRKEKKAESGKKSR